MLKKIFSDKPGMPLQKSTCKNIIFMRKKQCKTIFQTKNSVPNSVVDASTIDALNVRLDKFWMHQAVKYAFTADLTGTRN